MVIWFRSLLRRSIRMRLTITLCVGLGMMLAAIFVSFDYVIGAETFGRFDAGLETQARAIAAILADAPRDAIPGAVDPVNAQLQREIRTDFFQVWDSNGKSLQKSDSCGADNLRQPKKFEARETTFYNARLPDGLLGRAVALRLNLPEHGYAQPLTIVVSEQREEIDGLERYAHYALLIGIVLALLMTTALAAIAVQRGLYPLERFGASAALLTPQNLTTDFDLAAMPQELAPVARTLNDAFARLLAAVERERGFARAVAHELRTPLAVMRTVTEHSLSHSESDSARKSLTTLLTTVDGMTRSVDGLLSLVRYEAGLDQIEEEPVELGGLITSQLGLLQQRISARHLRILRSVPKEAWVLSDTALVERIVANLLVNAVDYAEQDSDLFISIDNIETVDSNVASLEFRNAAPSLTEQDLQHFGERYWRKNDENETIPHGGLGLALTRAFAAALGVELEFVLHGGYLCARITQLKAIAFIHVDGATG